MLGWVLSLRRERGLPRWVVADGKGGRFAFDNRIREFAMQGQLLFCGIRGLVGRNAVCGAVRAAGTYCGHPGECQHQQIGDPRLVGQVAEAGTDRVRLTQVVRLVRH